MAGINLFKIDNNKKDKFHSMLQEYSFVEKNSLLNRGINYSFSLYVSKPSITRQLGWNWVFSEFGKTGIQLDSNPTGILTIEKNNILYAVSFGHSFFKIDKFCDKEFAFDFARRINYDEIKTATLSSPHSKKNKTINTYIGYDELEYDSGQSYSKIKIRNTSAKELFSPSIEIGTSIKFNVKNPTLDKMIDLIDFIETILQNKVINKIPLCLKINDKEKIMELDKKLQDKILSDIGIINISELDIIGATEVFNYNDGQFVISYLDNKKEVSILSLDEIKNFCDDNNLNIEDCLLKIKIKTLNDNEVVRTDTIYNLIDYTDDENRCLLSKGVWYSYNDDYIQYLNDSISEIECIYDERFDFSDDIRLKYIDSIKDSERKNYIGYSEEKLQKTLNNKYYLERVFNLLREKEGFSNYDRDIDLNSNMKFEATDLYKDGVIYTVKIGSGSSKLCYAVTQSLTTLKMYKHNQIKNVSNITTVSLWFVLNRKTKIKQNELGNPDLRELNMLSLKNMIDNWKKEVRACGLIPQIVINYIN